MNQLFYNGGIVHQIRREKRTVKRSVTAQMTSLLFRFPPFSFPFYWWGESLFVSIIVAKYNIFPLANNGRLREKQKLWRSDLRLCPGVPVHRGNNYCTLLFTKLCLAVAYCWVHCIGSCVPVHEDRTPFAHAISVHYRDFEHAYVY